jgi:peptidoglycan-N-acetylglucosamine deacetylase
MADVGRTVRLAARLAGVCAAGLAIVQAGPGLTGFGPVRAAAFPRLAGRGDPGHVALSFDDGPDPAATPGFLDLLAARGIRATFFMLGSMMLRAPGLAAEVAAAGHEVGVHGFVHRYLPLRGPAATRSDLTRATELVADVTGSWPRFFRPPYGVLSGPALLAVHDLGLTPVLWGAWGREWDAGATGDSVLQNLLRGLDGGVTVLLHDSDGVSKSLAAPALAALPSLLDECAARGLRVGPVSDHGLLARSGAGLERP